MYMHMKLYFKNGKITARNADAKLGTNFILRHGSAWTLLRELVTARQLVGWGGITSSPYPCHISYTNFTSQPPKY